MSAESVVTEEPFAVHECIEATRDAFEYKPSVGAGGDWENLPPGFIEEMFLPGQVVADNYGSFSLTAVTRMLPLMLLRIPPTKEDVSFVHEGSVTSLKLFANLVETDAQAMRSAHPTLFSRTTFQEVRYHRDRLSYAGDISRAGLLLSLLETEGYIILPPIETLPTRMVVVSNEDEPWTTTKMPDNFLTINLDELARLRPGLMGQRLVEWHTYRAYVDFAEQAMRNLALHAPFKNYVPSFLLKLAGLGDEERQAETTQCQTILGRLATLGAGRPDYKELVSIFFSPNGPLVRGVDSRPDGIRIDNALEHVALCPGSNTPESTQALIIAAIRQQLLNGVPLKSEQLSPNDALVITSPWLYLRLNQNPQVVRQFIHKYRLPRDIFEPLVDIVPRTRPTRLQEPQYFSLLANMIILTGQGRANIISPVQRTLIADVYRTKPAQLETLKQIVAFWNQMDEKTKPDPSAD